MAKHTPGPWTFLKENDGDVWVYGSGSRRSALCRMLPPLGYYLDGKTGERVDMSMENLANAKLVAAAPDLLEALKEVLPLVDAWFDDKIDKARAAIAKAKGGGEDG